MRILMLGPWCIRKPLHGGQIRASHIVEAYRAAGHEVLFVGLYHPTQTPRDEYSETDLPITTPVLEHAARIPRTQDIRLWYALADEPTSFAQYCDRIAHFTPDVIQFEEPVFWPLVRRLVDTGILERGHGRIRILHSSYNIEHTWRRASREGATPQDEAFSTELEILEQDIARRADAVCVVSKSDAVAFRGMGAEAVVVAPNGSAITAPTPEALRTVSQYLNHQPFALFVSSAHPPNASGLMHMIRGAPGVRLRNGIVVIGGDVARLLQPYSADPQLQHLFRDIRLLGRIPTDDLLAAFYAHAHVAIVPRTIGGGSNLKTAEALLSSRPIVAASRAFVGFEEYADAPGVHMTDDPVAFWRAIDELLGKPLAASITRRGMNALAWKHTLEPMVEAVESLA
jgi:glycosyltransferase involved in cell wall biosynthesis